MEPSSAELNKAICHRVVELCNGGVSEEEHIVKVLARVDETSPLQGWKEDIHLEDDVADREQKTDFTRQFAFPKSLLNRVIHCR